MYFTPHQEHYMSWKYVTKWLPVLKQRTKREKMRDLFSIEDTIKDMDTSFVAASFWSPNNAWWVNDGTWLDLQTSPM